MTKERRYLLEARALQLVERVIERLPRCCVLALGRSLGRLWSDLDARHVRIAADNLRRAFPTWDEARVLRTARAVYEHFGAMLLDLLWMGGRPVAEAVALVDVEGGAHVEAAMSEGRGVLMITGHFGNWELAGLFHGARFGAMGVVARPLDNPALDAKLVSLRVRGGNTVIYKQRALQQVLRLVHDGKSIALVIDQNVQEGGVFVSFFGRPAASAPVASALTLKTGAPIVPAFCELLPNGRYRMSYGAAIRNRPSGDRQADILRVTQETATLIESAVRARPEQWLWLHRRWKTQP